MSSAEADLMSSFADACAHFGAYGLVGPLLGEPVPQGGRLGVGFIITGRCPVLVLAPRWGYDYELPPALAGGLERAIIGTMCFSPTR